MRGVLLAALSGGLAGLAFAAHAEPPPTTKPPASAVKPAIQAPLIKPAAKPLQPVTKTKPPSGEINVPELSFIGGAVSATTSEARTTTINAPELSFIGGAVTAAASTKPVVTTIAVPELSFVGR